MFLLFQFEKKVLETYVVKCVSNRQITKDWSWKRNDAEK